MSDYHILMQSNDLKTVEVVFHFPVPTTNNSAGVSYRNALVLYLGGADAINSQVATPAELTQMKAGSLLEQSTQMRFSIVGLSNAQKLAEITAFYTAEKTRKLAELAITLDFYGYSGTAA